MPTRTSAVHPRLLRPPARHPFTPFSAQEEPTLVRSREYGRGGQVRVLLLNGLLPGLRINLAIGLL